MSLRRKAKDVRAKQIKELSFTQSGGAFQHPTEGFEGGPVFINAQKPSSKLYKKVLAEDPPEGHAKSRFSISLTDRETQSEPSPGLYKFMLVGWVPQGKTNIDVPKPKYGVVVGTTRPPANQIIRYDPEDTDDFPLMAVVKRTEDPNETSTRTYVLLYQRDDVCSPFVVNSDEVYYLCLFRDNSTANKNRKSNWNRNVARYAVAPNTKAPTQRQSILRRARDQSKLNFSEELSIEKYINALAAAYVKMKDPRCLEKIKKIIDDIGAPPANPALHAFANLGDPGSGPYTLVEAQKVVTEIQIEYPDLELNGWNVLVLGQSIQLASLMVPYENLQSFIREGVHMIQQAIDSGDLDDDLFEVETLKSIANEANDRVVRFLNYAKRPVDLAEDHALKITLQDIWENHSDITTTNVAREAFMDISKFVMVAMRNSGKDMAMVVEQVVDILQRAGA
jgi:hypothetical protein